MTDIDLTTVLKDTEFIDDHTNNGQQNIIMAIGVGGGGNNAINHMYRQGIKDVSFVVCNTDQQALNSSPVQTQLLIGPNTTFGLGAGNKPELAKKAAEESCNEINGLFNDHLKMVFITAGMGGGTGTGAAPVVARLAKERGLLTIGIVTIPFLFEGEKKILKALEGADEMSKYVDSLLLINNERITEIYHDYDFINAFDKADDTLAIAARSISEIITVPGKINLDFTDVDTTLRKGGAAIISSGYGEGEHRMTKAIENALESPLLKNRDVYGSKKLLFNIYISPDAEERFLMSEVEELTDFVAKIYHDVDVIWGISYDNSLGNKVKITILASGFDITIRDDEKKKKWYSQKDRLEEEYGNEKLKQIQRAKTAANFIIIPFDKMDDDSTIDEWEKTPTYNRNKEITKAINMSVKNVDESSLQTDTTTSTTIRF